MTFLRKPSILIFALVQVLSFGQAHLINAVQYPEKYGAVDDGAHDDTAAFRAAHRTGNFGRNGALLRQEVSSHRDNFTGMIDVDGTGAGCQPTP